MLLTAAGSRSQKDWSQIAAHLDGRTGEQCRQRFYSRPTKKYKKGGWTKEEDETIIRMHDEHGNRWSEIAKRLADRSESSIKNRWCDILQHRNRPADSREAKSIPSAETNFDPQTPHDSPLEQPSCHTAPVSEPSAIEQSALTKSFSDPPTTGGAKARITPWTREEDRLLLDAVRQLSAPAPRRRDWPRIALQVAGRSGRQCWQRYHHQLKSDFRAGGWTAEEDAAIVAHQARLGNRWAAIARHLPHRSANAVKNRWHCFLRRRHVNPAQPRRAGKAGSGHYPFRGTWR